MEKDESLILQVEECSSSRILYLSISGSSEQYSGNRSCDKWTLNFKFVNEQVTDFEKGEQIDGERRCN
jgi:hypothetical protein